MGLLCRLTCFHFRLKAEVVDNVKEQADEEGIGYVEERGRGCVELDERAALDKDVAEPEIGADRTEDGVGCHHDGDVDHNDIEHDAPMPHQLIRRCCSILFH